MMMMMIMYDDDLYSIYPLHCNGLTIKLFQ